MLGVLAADPAPASLTVSAPNLNYHVELFERDQRGYVGLIEVLDPLGAVSATSKGSRWKLHFQNVDAEFSAGSTTCKIAGHKLDLDAPFWLEGGRGLVPASSLFALLSRLQALPVSYQEATHRVLLGSAIPAAPVQLAPPPAQVQMQAQVPTPAPVQATPSAPAVAQPPTSQPAAAASAPHRFTVLLDASHGGADSGAALGESGAPAEKDVTLAFAHRLRTELESRGVAATILRDGDTTLAADQRAVMVNTYHADLYVALHVSTLGTSVRVVTALLPATTGAASGDDARGPFLPWNAAQQRSLVASRDAAAALVSALQAQKLGARTFAAPLSALNHAAGPALAVEIASPAGGRELTSVAFQQPIIKALATGILNARPGLEARP